MQRVIAVITFFILLAGGYYWFIIDESRTSQMIELESSDESLKGDYNATTEKYDRFDLRLIGHGKHLKTLQDETHAHYDAYASKMDSIDVVFERMKLDIEQLEERFHSYKRIYLLKQNFALLYLELEDLPLRLIYVKLLYLFVSKHQCASFLAAA